MSSLVYWMGTSELHLDFVVLFRGSIESHTILLFETAFNILSFSSHDLNVR
jgi:hypothetical protein